MSLSINSLPYYIRLFKLGAKTGNTRGEVLTTTETFTTRVFPFYLPLLTCTFMTLPGVLHSLHAKTNDNICLFIFFSCCGRKHYSGILRIMIPKCFLFCFNLIPFSLPWGVNFLPYCRSCFRICLHLNDI